MHKTQPLCVTPVPNSLESWIGHILRLSADNALPSPIHMLKYAGWEKKSLTEIPVEIILALTGKSISAYAGIAPINADGEEQLGGHQIARKYHNLTTPRICPSCITELGYIDARWDLYHYLVCDKHNIRLVEKCPGCFKLLNWQRPELDICKCKSKIIQRNKTPAPTSLIELSKLISAIFERRQLYNTDSELRVDFEGFSQMSLKTFIAFIHDIAQRSFHLKRELTKMKFAITQESICTEAARILSDWPNNFFKLLVADQEICSSDEMNIVQRNSSIFNLIFRNNHPHNEVSFLFKNFVLFAKLTHSEFKVDDVESEQFDHERLKALSLEELLTELNLNVEFLKKELPTFPAKQQKVSIASRIRDDEWDFNDKLDDKNNGAIAKALRLPLNVVNAMMVDNSDDAIYKDFSFRKNLRNSSVLFHKLLKNRSIHRNNVIRQELISLKAVLKFNYPKGIVEVLKANLNKTLCSYYDPKKNDELYFVKDEVMSFFEFGTIPSSDSLSVQSFAKSFNITVKTLQAVASNGLLTITPFKDTSYIRKTDLEDFQKQYLMLGEVAKFLKYPVNSLIKISRDNDLRIAKSPNGTDLVPYVIFRSELDKLKLLVRHKQTLN